MPGVPRAYLWCPAYPLASPAQVAATRARAMALVERTGHQLSDSPLLGELAPAGAWLDATVRREDLRRALGHDLLLAARGGYGCIHLLPALAGVQRLPPLVGYSDLTVLHAAWRCEGTRRSGQPDWCADQGPGLPAAGVYGFMPAVAAGPRALASTAAWLTGGSYPCDSRTCPEARVLHEGEAEGPLVPACLRVLASLVGTPVMPTLGGCLLALEDIDERPYQIDRDLEHLALTGALAGIRGLLFGRFPVVLPPGYGGPSVDDLLARWGARLGVPAVAGIPFGHEEDPLSLPCSRRMRLEAHQRDWGLTPIP